MTWRVAASLDVLLDEINRFAPHRSKVSDGSIGDAAHALRDSDHNPWTIDNHGVGVVRARDFTHDPAGGLDGNVLADHLAAMIRAGTHPALASGAYVIWNRRILSRDRVGEGWRVYTGSNPHDHHVHLSVATARVGYDSRAPWGIDNKEDDMPYTDWPEKDRKALVRDISAALREELSTAPDVMKFDNDGDPATAKISIAESHRVLLQRTRQAQA